MVADRIYYEDCPTCNGRPYHWITDHKMCEEHDRCTRCNIQRKDLKEVPWGSSKGPFLCKPCNIALQSEAIEDYNSPEDQEEYGSDPKCPYCGTIYEPDCEGGFYQDGTIDVDCGTCGCVFSCEVYVSFSYTCTKKLTKE